MRGPSKVFLLFLEFFERGKRHNVGAKTGSEEHGAALSVIRRQSSMWISIVANEPTGINRTVCFPFDALRFRDRCFI